MENYRLLDYYHSFAILEAWNHVRESAKDDMSDIDLMQFCIDRLNTYRAFGVSPEAPISNPGLEVFNQGSKFIFDPSQTWDVGTYFTDTVGTKLSNADFVTEPEVTAITTLFEVLQSQASDVSFDFKDIYSDALSNLLGSLETAEVPVNSIGYYTYGIGKSTLELYCSSKPPFDSQVPIPPLFVPAVVVSDLIWGIAGAVSSAVADDMDDKPINWRKAGVLGLIGAVAGSAAPILRLARLIKPPRIF